METALAELVGIIMRGGPPVGQLGEATRGLPYAGCIVSFLDPLRIPRPDPRPAPRVLGSRMKLRFAVTSGVTSAITIALALAAAGQQPAPPATLD